MSDHCRLVLPVGKLSSEVRRRHRQFFRAGNGIEAPPYNFDNPVSIACASFRTSTMSAAADDMETLNTYLPLVVAATTSALEPTVFGGPTTTSKDFGGVSI